MNYLLKSKPKHEHRWKIITVAVLFGILFFFGFIFSDFSRNIFWQISRPFWVGENLISKSVRGFSGFFSSKNTLIKKNLELEDKIASLELKEIDHDSLLKENQELKEQIGRKIEKNLVFAKVLSKPPRSPYDTFVLDIGSNQGIAPGGRVYISDNVIIGLVTTVTSNTSLTKLFSSSGNKQESVLSRTGASFLLEGQGGANFELVVPKDTDILWGDTFTYPGLNYPVLGSVYYIDTNSQSSFKTIYIRTPGNVFQSQSVFVDVVSR